jgi:transcriptional regulator with XRE-family HTH domain
MAYKPELERLVRKALEGVSMMEAHKATGVSKSHIGNMAQGVAPSRDKLLRFAEGLGLDPVPLFLAAGYAPPGTDPEHPDIRPFAEWLASQARQGVEGAREALRIVAEEAPKTGAQILMEGLDAIAQEFGPQTIHFEGGWSDVTPEEAEQFLEHQRKVAARLAEKNAQSE